MRLHALACCLLAVVAPVRAQTIDPNACDPGEAPDLVVAEIFNVVRYDTRDGRTAFAFGTDACNLGMCAANFQGSTRDHPVIATNLYRLGDGRFEQIGQSWVKHGFGASADATCSADCVDPLDFTRLGVNCSDAYDATTNGYQPLLGPRFEINPVTGEFPFPATDLGRTGNVLYKRLQVRDADLDAQLHRGARWFVEAQYIARDDAAAGHGHNNVSYREVRVVGPSGAVRLELTGETQRESAAIGAWGALDPAVVETIVDVPGDGRFIVAAKATLLDGAAGTWRYEYAVHNLDSHRAARAFEVPLPRGVAARNLAFHDVDYHSGEPFSGTDWSAVAAADGVVWSTQLFRDAPNANALRWGTLYNFRFDAPVGPAYRDVFLELFRPGEPKRVAARVLAPAIQSACDRDGVCDPGEDCATCLVDCGRSCGF